MYHKGGSDEHRFAIIREGKREKTIIVHRHHLTLLLELYIVNLLTNQVKLYKENLLFLY